MANFGDLSTELQNDVGGRTNNDVKTAVDAAINRAIEQYEQERFSFNVGTDDTLNSIIDIVEYTLPAKVLSVIGVQFRSAGDLDVLQQWPYTSHLRAITDDTNLLGEPDYFAIFGRQMFVYPAPSEVSPFTISGVLRENDIPFDDDAETNAWTNEGLSLIRARAKWDLYTNRFKNAELAAINKADTEYHLRRLRRDVEQLETTGRIPLVEPF